jgi:CBS domain-containing protein
MASANSGLQITNLDFGSIKNSLKSFLQQQDTLKDYNFDGSSLSILLDLLAYNTQYNAYYLNMVANEMFMDSAIQRGSVVSQAKLLNYIPRSAVAPVATVNVVVYGVTTSTLTMPKFSQFISETVGDKNYTFLTKDATTVNVTANTATFNQLEIYQGLSASYSYAYNSTNNPKAIFTIPDTNIDTGTLLVTVQESTSNLISETYLQASDYLALTPSSKVYFLQEGMDGYYQVYFGDGVLGKALNNNNVVNISYITTDGTAAFGANSFTITQSVGGFSNVITQAITSASQGADKETIDSIKFSAPKAFAAQGRAVTKDDYIYLIQNNTSNFPVDSVSVWGGEKNDPPVYGQIFCAIKPSGGFTLTPTQKERIITDVIKPISVLTVVPTIVDPDYNFVKINTTVLYDPKKTTLNGGQIKQSVITAINSFAKTTLNTFNSTFKLPDLITSVQLANPSIITNETNIRLQKKIYPKLNSKTSYQLNFGVPLKRNYFNAGVNSSPDFSTVDVNALGNVRTGVFFEEVPTTVGGIGSVNVVNQGYSYTKTPTVTITGDGTGAEAYAVLVAGRVNSIVVTNPGYNYTQAVATISNASGDTTGASAYAVPVLEGSIGTLRTYYYQNNIKQILNSNAGTVDYVSGVVTLTDFAPLEINDPLGQFTISVVPDSTIVSSTFNRIIALD